MLIADRTVVAAFMTLSCMDCGSGIKNAMGISGVYVVILVHKN
jgi:hypothetical protein